MKQPTGPKVGRPCSICRSPQRDEIDKAILYGSQPNTISKNFNVGVQAVARHRQQHMPLAARAEAAEAIAEAEAERGSDLLAGAASLRRKALELLAAAEDAGDLRTALAGVREAARTLELEARLRGELGAGGDTVNIVLAPQFVFLQRTIIQALARFPDALVAVQGAFLQIEGAASA